MLSMLLVYLGIGIGMSFLCSLLEAVLLSVPRSHVAVMNAEGSKAGALLARMKEDVDRPLAAILTLNTFAHTIGAAGVGMEAAKVFGDAWVGVVSFVVTLLILIFSEIIPKTIGAVHCRALAPLATRITHFLMVVLMPFVVACNWLSKLMTGRSKVAGFSREEVGSIATIALEEGAIDSVESELIHNMIGMTTTQVRSVMTPRPVVGTLNSSTTIGELLDQDLPSFARLPLIERSLDDARTYVHRHDVLKAISDGRTEATLRELERPLGVVPETADLRKVMTDLIRSRSHMALVVDEHGGGEGIVTLEDCLETLLGHEIVDETDGAVDMRAVAKRLAKD